LSYDDRQAAKDTVPFAEQFFNPLDPVLQRTAARHEDTWADRLRSRGYTELNREYNEYGDPDELVEEDGQIIAKAFDWEDDHSAEAVETEKRENSEENQSRGFRACLRDVEPEKPLFAREVEIRGTIGAFDVTGRMDFVIVLWENGDPRLRVVETKSSRKEKTNQRIQVAIYEILLGQALNEEPLHIGTESAEPSTIGPNAIECTVGRIEESTNELQDLLQLDAATLVQEREDVQELLKPGGVVEDVVNTPQDDIDSLDYKLESKCDQCVFDVHCFPESARQRKLELLGLDPTTIERFAEAGGPDEGIENIDDLAEIDLDSKVAEELRSADNVREDIGQLRQAARSRRQNLPGDTPEDEYEVTKRIDAVKSMLPEHEISGEQLIRVYLDIEYDYVEDRIAAAAAHVTKSSWELNLDFEEEPASTADFDSGTLQVELSDFVDYNPDPEPFEQEPNPFNQKNRDELENRRLSDAYDAGEETVSPVTAVVPDAWRGEYGYDSGSESAMLSNFLQDVNERIQTLADGDQAYVHFYVWSENEMDHLVDACARSHSNLLSDLRELLGSREPTEQLIYTTLQSEIRNRYSLGWTGEGLVVGADLRWFGDIFHWVRNVDGNKTRISNVFTQSIFDFKTERDLTANNEWAEEDDEVADNPKFELRSRFNDDLPVPYLHAVWNTLPAPEDFNDDPNAKSAVERYHRADRSTLVAYLETRVEALRWLEEHCQHRDDDITKQKVEIPDLPKRDRSIEGTAMVARDFLQLDHHMRVSEWLSEHMQPLSHQVSTGDAIPIKDGVFMSEQLRLSMDFSEMDMGTEEFRLRTGFEEGKFVHVCIAPADITEGPSYKQLTNTGRTGPIESINWEDGYIDIDVISSAKMNSSFVMKSLSDRDGLLSESFGDSGDPPEQFMLIESVTDFTGRRCYNRLQTGKGAHVFDWFNPRSPSIPRLNSLPADQQNEYQDMLQHYNIKEEKTLKDGQLEAVMDGLDTRVQLLLGPPGTGKTTTTATAILTRILECRETGDFVLLVGSTHRAVNELLTQLDDQKEPFRKHVEETLDESLPEIKLTKAMSAVQPEDEPEADSVEIIDTQKGFKRKFNDLQKDGVVIIGGTISSVLKLMGDSKKGLEGGSWFGYDDGRPFADELIVDEASMMKFPSFLAVSTLVDTNARIMVTGDHQQLSPIVAHDWEEEQRPSVQEFEPHRSAFKLIQDIAQSPNITESQARSSELNFTFRLPPEIRGLIRQLYEEDVELGGETAEDITLPSKKESPMADVWQQDTGLFLIEHTEERSRVSNPTETEIVKRLLENASGLKDGSVAVITPHTAQRARLQTELEDFIGEAIAPGSIDTVERFQGGECETVIVSATASDQTAISENKEFLLDLNRANVAFSRAEQRLIVVCSETLLNYIPPEMEEYMSAKLWKTLRRICGVEHNHTSVAGHEATLRCIDEETREVQEILSEMERDSSE
jgi:hypothetical protein